MGDGPADLARSTAEGVGGLVLLMVTAAGMFGALMSSSGLANIMSLYLACIG